MNVKIVRLSSNPNRAIVVFIAAMVILHVLPYRLEMEVIAARYLFVDILTY